MHGRASPNKGASIVNHSGPRTTKEYATYLEIRVRRGLAAPADSGHRCDRQLRLRTVLPWHGAEHAAIETDLLSRQ